MRRTPLIVAAAALLVLAGACVDRPSPMAPETPDETAVLKAAQEDIFWSRGCPRIGTVTLLAAVIFSHDRNAWRQIQTDLTDLDGEVRRGRKARIQAIAHRLVDFLLARHAAGNFRGTDAQLAALINAIYCSAGIDLSLSDPDNTILVLPSDGPQVATNADGNAGLSLPANAVTEPTLIAFELIPDDFPVAGDGPLDTKLDQYPGFLQITQSSETGAPLAQPVVVGVCAAGAIAQEIRDRLRLGHGASGGFELTPPADASFLSCPNDVASAAADPLWKRLAMLALPKALHASSRMLEGGGVGGTVTEFSPFAPVDPQLAFGGGVGGTVTEFIGQSALTTLTNSPRPFLVDDCSVGIAGSAVPPECRPFITITTALGTIMTGVPVEWAVTAGGGTVAARTSVCGAYGAGASTTTNGLGRAAICWNLGAVGSNSVKATPSAGGDAPEGVTFVPTDISFTVNAVAGDPHAVELVSGGGQTAPEFGTLAPIVVRIVDILGNPVPGVTVHWQVTGGGGYATGSPPSNASGQATSTWVLGTAGPQTLKVYFEVNSLMFAYTLVYATALAP